MAGFKLAGAALFTILTGIQGSTCHGQPSSGTGDTATKAPEGTPTDVTLSGVDTSMLTPREKKEWSSYVSDFLAPCSDVPVSVAQCVQEKRACSRCLPAAKFVLKGVRDGMSKEQIEKSFHGRFDADRIKNVPIDGSPFKGPDGAPVTIVEFADFECPFCAMEAPVLEKTWQEHKSELRFVYKFLPLSAHPHGEVAARAGIASIAQGKFWEMHDTLFAHRDHLEPSDIDGYAKQLGLDVARLHTDMQSAATTERIQRDRKLADSLGVQGTPTIYINGRDYDPHADLNEWLALELSMNGNGGAATAPSPTASVAAPSPAPSPSAAAKR